MKAMLTSVVALFVSLALLQGGTAMLGTLIALRLGLDGASQLMLGLMMAFYSAGFILGAMRGVVVIRKVGHIRAFAVYAALACAAILAHPIVLDHVAWLAMRFVFGFCVAGLLTVTESWIHDRATNETRGKLLGIYTVNYYAAFGVGQLLVGLGNPSDFILYSGVAMLIVLSLVPLALTQSLIPSTPTDAEGLSWRRLVRQAPAGATGALASGIALGCFLGLAPVYALDYGLSVAQVSGYMGFSVLCAIFVQWPAGWLSDRLGRLPVVVGLQLIAALAALGTALLGPVSMVALFAFSGVFYALSTAMYPMSVALTTDQVDSSQMVAACAAMLRTFGIGTMVGPLVAAAAMQGLGNASLFVFLAAALVGAAGLIQIRFRVSDSVPLDEQGAYVAVTPVSSPLMAEIDPRNEDFDANTGAEPSDWDLADKLEILVMDTEDLVEQRVEEALEERVEELLEERVEEWLEEHGNDPKPPPAGG